MKVLLALAFLLWLGADAQYNPEQDVRYPPEHVERRYSPEYSLRGSPFVIGKTHRYELTINITAGVPGLTSQVAKSIIQLQVNIRPKTENEYVLKAEYVKVSEPRSSVDSGDAPLPLREFPELERDLSQPIRFTYEDGEVKSYTLGHSESLPSRSIKRAILRHLQMKLVKNPRRDERYREYYPVTYSTTERDEAGPYEAIYTVNVSPYPEFPYEDKVYNITRVHNYEPYGYPAYYERHNFAKQGCPEVCKPGDYPPHNRYGAGCPVGYEPYQTPVKASKIVYHNLRYIHGKYVIENVQVEEKSVASLYDQDLVVSIESQYVLKEVSDRRFEEPRERQVEYTELYTAPTEEELKREQERESEDVTEEYQFLYGIFDNVRSSELVVIASRILEKLSASVVAAEIESTRAQEVTEDVAHLQDVFSLLKKHHLDAVYRRVPDIRTLRRAPEIERVKRQFFLEILPLAGTDDSVEFIKYLIEERQLSVYEAQEILQAIPENLIKATEKNVQDLLALTELPYVKQHHMLHSAVYLAVSNVIRKAYVIPRVYGYDEDQPGYDTRRRERDYEYPREFRRSKYYNRYDNEVYRHHRYQDEQYPGSYRRQHYRYSDETRQYGEVTLRKYIQEIRSKLKSATKLQDKFVYIEALAQLGYKEALKVLKPYVYGYAEDTEDYTPGDVDYLKTVAIYALHHIVEYYPEETQEVVAPVYFTHDEAPKVRIAAFSVLLRSQPSLGLLQHIAQDSYDEPSYEVGSYVYSALQTYGNATTPCMKLTAERIKKVFSQVKTYDFGKQYSKSVIKTFFDELRNFGVEKRFAVVQSNESFIPTTIYTSLEYNLQSMKDIFYQTKLNVQGVTVEDLLKTIDYEVLGFRPPRDIPEGVESHIFKGLNLIPRLPKEMRLAFYRKIFYNTAYYYVDAQSIASFIFPIVDYVQDYLSAERGVLSGHFVKAYIPSSYQSLTYSSVGFPVDFRMKHPLVFSLKVESRRPPRGQSASYSFYVRPSVYYGTYYKHSIFNTAVHRAYGVYQEQKYIATYPFELSFYVDDEYNTLEVIYKLPEVPKRVYRQQAEAGTYERELKLSFVPSAEENREPIKTIPTLFQREYVVKGFGFPSLFVTYYTEDIQEEHADVPQDLEDVLELIVDAYNNPGFRRKDVNVTIVSRPSSPVDQVKFTFSYHRTYDARSESQNPGYTGSHDSSVKDFSRSRHMTYATHKQGRVEEDEYAVLSRIFPERRVPVGEYEEITPEQAHKVYEAFSERLSNVAHELRLKVETSPNVQVAELKVEYNHTFDKTLHSVRAEVEAYAAERRTPYKVHLVHVMRYVNSPNAFRYNTRAYVGQYASFFNAITFGERPRTYEQSDVISQGAFVKVPAEQLFTRNEFPENPGREVFLPEYYEECQKDVQEGKSLTPACIAAVEEDARLNKVYIRARARVDLPPVVQNLTYKLEDAIKYYYYEQAEFNSVNVRNTPRTFEMVINYIDKLTEKPVLDVYMKKPSENIIYHKVDFEYLEPLSSVYTLRESYKLRSTNYTYPPFCALMEKYVKTFDKEVYPLPHDGCTYVLSTHCTERKKFAVLAKRTSPSDDYKEVYIYVADQKVLLKPERTPTGVYNIVYNDRPVEVRTPVLLDEENLLYAYPVAVYDENVKYVLVLRAEKAGIKVEYDGKNVKLEVSPVYKGELCGLCSEFDGEIAREYRGPNQYLYVDSEDFVRSSVIDADICGVNPEPKNPVLHPHGQYRGRQLRGSYPPYAPYNYDPYRRSRYPYGEESEENRRYPYRDESEVKPRYPYYSEDEVQDKYRYPYTDENDSQEKSRYPYTGEEDYERKYRYPYDEEDELYPKRRSQNIYPYYGKDESYRKSRYPYAEDYSTKYKYPFEDQSEYGRKPYDEKDQLRRRYGYPYYDQDESFVKFPYPSDEESYRKYRYPYEDQGYYSEGTHYTRGDQEEIHKKSRYPYDEEEYFYRKPHFVYDEQEESYNRSRYPYSDRYYSFRKPGHFYDEQDESYVKSRYPYGDKYESYRKSRYPYDEQDYPYDEEDEYYRKSRYPYDYQDESYEKRRYPYGDQDESYERRRYPYHEQDESYEKRRYPYGDQDESYERRRYPYDEQDESYEKRSYPYGDRDESYERTRYPYDEDYEESRKPYYAHEQKDESYKKYRSPYAEFSERSRYPYYKKVDSYQKTKYPYYKKEDSYQQTSYPYYKKEDSYEKTSYPYYKKDDSRYPYYKKGDSYQKTSYPYSEEKYVYKKSGYVYDKEDGSYKKFRNPYEEQEYSPKSKYPYYDNVESYKRSRYPYGDKYYSEKSYQYYDDRDDSYKTHYPYDDEYYSYRKHGYPYGYEDESYGESKYPYGYQDKVYGDQRYPYGYEDKTYSKEKFPYYYKDKSYRDSRYPYGYEDKSYGETRYPYDYEDKSYSEERYPYGYVDKTYSKEKFPYYYKDKSYRESRYPYGYEDKSYGETRYPYDYEDKSYSEERYPYGYEDKTYSKEKFPYYYKDKTYRESRYPYGYEDKSYGETRYPYDYEDKSYIEERYPYGYEDKSYSKEKFPYYYKDKAYRESRYPYGYEDKSYGETKYPFNYEDKSYSETRYPYFKDDSYKKFPYPDEEKPYDESRYTKTKGDDSYERRSDYTTTYGDKSYRKLFYAGKDEEKTTSYEKGADVKIQPKERTVYIERNEKICFSTHPVPVCEEGYKPTEEYQKSVDYHCLPKDDVTTKRLITESNGRVLRELASKKVDYTESYTAAKYCSV